MGLGSRYRLIGGGTKFLLGVAALTVALHGMVMMAQNKTQVADGGVPTLHVYTNLIQVPTLVLAMNNDRIDKPIAASRFSISIDSGRWFRATHARPEGDDPISLSILMDVSGEAATLPTLGDAIGNLAPVSLHANDRVSIYALGCSLVRSPNNVPPYRAVLQDGVRAVLERSMLRKSNQGRKNQGEKNCELKGHLWDGLAQVAVALSDLPGRRVILVVTDGRDTGSKNSWNGVRFFAQAKGISIFALNFAAASIGVRNYGAGQGAYLLRGGGSYDVEYPLNSVCELSGGIVMSMDRSTNLSKSLERFVTMLRERYIVEFPRASNSTEGEHGLEVKIDEGIYKVRPSGVSVRLPDPAWAADPTTIQTGPAQTPEEGTRKVMKKPK